MTEVVVSNKPHCVDHEDVTATHAVMVKGTPGLVLMCCGCAEGHNRCAH